MNVYKKLSFMAVLCINAYIHADENQETPQKEFSNHEYTEAEISLLNFLDALHADGNYKDNLRQVVHEAQQSSQAVKIFARIKNDIKHPRFKSSIGFLDKHLSTTKQCHIVLWNFLKKDMIVGVDQTDISNFAPRFAECTDVLSNENDQRFAIYNINRLLHLQKIKHGRRDYLKKSQPAQAKNNLGSWIRNSETFQEKIDEEILIQEEKKDEMDFICKNYPHFFDAQSTNNSPLHNFAKNTQFCWEKSSDEPIQKISKEKIEQCWDNSLKEKFKKIIKESQASNCTVLWNESLNINNNIQEMKQYFEKKEEEKRESKFFALSENNLDFMLNQDSYYKILKLKKSASSVDIKNAYHELARKKHPDKNLDNQEAANENLKKLNAAYQALYDKHEKQEKQKAERLMRYLKKND